MKSLRSHEGYFLMDHSASPGLPGDLIDSMGFPRGAGTIKFESATFTCSHCQAVVVLNPDRARSRGYCRKCDHYICDHCEGDRVRTGLCRPFKAVIAEYLEQVDKGCDPVQISQSLIIP